MDEHDHAGRDPSTCGQARGCRVPALDADRFERTRAVGGSAGDISAPRRHGRATQIGMPLTGRNNLAETPLLQYLGDQRWRHVSRVLDVPSGKTG